MTKYQVIGGKEPGRSGRVLSNHRTLTTAKRSARRYSKKGYSGMIYREVPIKKNSKILKHMKKEDRGKHKTYWKGQVTFTAGKGVRSNATRRRK